MHDGDCNAVLLRKVTAAAERRGGEMICNQKRRFRKKYVSYRKKTDALFDFRTYSTVGGNHALILSFGNDKTT